MKKSILKKRTLKDKDIIQQLITDNSWDKLTELIEKENFSIDALNYFYEYKFLCKNCYNLDRKKFGTALIEKKDSLITIAIQLKNEKLKNILFMRGVEVSNKKDNVRALEYLFIGVFYSKLDLDYKYTDFAKNFDQIIELLEYSIKKSNYVNLLRIPLYVSEVQYDSFPTLIDSLEQNLYSLTYMQILLGGQGFSKLDDNDKEKLYKIIDLMIEINEKAVKEIKYQKEFLIGYKDKKRRTTIDHIKDPELISYYIKRVTKSYENAELKEFFDKTIKNYVTSYRKKAENYADESEEKKFFERKAKALVAIKCDILGEHIISNFIQAVFNEKGLVKDFVLSYDGTKAIIDNLSAKDIANISGTCKKASFIEILNNSEKQKSKFSTKDIANISETCKEASFVEILKNSEKQKSKCIIM